MIKQVRIFVKGDVIGVGFRAWTKIQAKYLGVKGWVKNAVGESGVEALLQAEEDKLNKILEIMKQGSPVSRVDSVDVKWGDPKEIFSDFRIIL